MNKQIEEMVIVSKCTATNSLQCPKTTCGVCRATKLYNAGYRKSTDVAREIIDLLREIQNDLQARDEFREASAVRYAIGQIEYYAEKKYESEGADDED